MGKWSKYGKKYKKEWENEADLREWLIEVEGDITKAACRFCNNRLRAHHSDLTAHAETVKHKRNSGQGGVVKREKKKPGGKKAVKKALTNMKEETVTVTAFLGKDMPTFYRLLVYYFQDRPNMTVKESDKVDQ